MTRWLKLAHRVALTGRHSSYYVGAIAVRGGSLLGARSNLARASWPAAHAGHAEERLLRDLKERARGAVVYVVRARASGRGSSKPCPRCRALLEFYGVKRVVYISIHATIESERIEAR